MPEKRGDSARIAFYTRISTDEDHQKYSLGAQKERLEAFCKAQWDTDWRLHAVYRDTTSGMHMNRPGLEQMLYDAEADAFDTLLVFRVDRLSRKVRELAQMVDALTKYGVALKSITEPFDTTNPAGKMMLQMLGVFAEFEHASIVERTKVGMEKKAKGGDWRHAGVSIIDVRFVIEHSMWILARPSGSRPCGLRLSAHGGYAVVGTGAVAAGQSHVMPARRHDYAIMQS